MVVSRAVALLVSVDFQVLGPLEVWDGERGIPLGGSKARSLLAILLLNSNRVVPTTRLIELLWGHEPPDTARNSLQVHVSQLRKALGRRAVDEDLRLLNHESGYVLQIAEDELDLNRFVALADQGREAVATKQHECAVQVLDAALGLWRGMPFGEFIEQPWAVLEVKRLEELRLRVLEDRTEAMMALGRHVEVLAELEGLVAQHPLRERLCGQLMLALYRAGRQADAIGVYHRTRERLVDELAVSPGADLQKLLKQLLNHDPALGWELERHPLPIGSANKHNLPVQLTSFIGRNRELTEIKRLLAEARLVTLSGPAGVGKTRLAVHAAQELIAEYPDGVWQVELAAITDPALVMQSVALVLGLREWPGEPLADALGTYLRDKRLLLVLDNCEHLLESVSSFTQNILKAGSDVRILTTSRERLSIIGERILRIDPLPTPDLRKMPPMEELPKVESIHLFTDRVAMVQPGFSLSAVNAPVIAQICCRLDGIPLAIELAAARANAVPAEEILERLNDRFQVLAECRATTAHHRTIRAALDWSYALLSDEEKTLFRRLGVFTGAWRLPSAEAVCATDPLASEEVMSRLFGLVDKSLVMADPDRDHGRYWLLETTREYSLERLAESGELESLRERHARCFLNVAETARPSLRSPERPKWLARLMDEEENLRAALAWSSDARVFDVGLRLATGLGPYWESRGLYIEGRRWLDLFLEHIPGATAARAEALYWGGWLAFRQSDMDAALRRAEESLAISKEIGDPALEALALQLLGCRAVILGDCSSASVWLTKSEQLNISIGNLRGLALVVGWQATRFLMTGDLARANAEADRALGYARRAEIPETGSDGDIIKAYVHIELGQLDEAHKRFDLGLRKPNQEVGYTICALQGLAGIAAAAGRTKRALQLEAAGDSIRDKHAHFTGLTPAPANMLYTRWMQRARDHLDGLDEQEVRARGALMSEDEAIQYALSNRD